jgi:two-component sensor histidine kinase
MEAAKVKENQEIWKTVREVDNRILAMAFVHQRLYESRNLSRIDMGDYVTELTLEILQNYGVLEKKIFTNFDVEDVSLLIDTAIPCGMALVELLSNTVKHAFPGERSGMVEVKLRRIEEDLLELSVSDNGVGVEDNFDVRKLPSIGLHTVVTIAEKQLNGQLKFEGSGGVRCSIIFSDTNYRERI